MIRILFALCLATFCGIAVSSQANDALDFWRREWSGWGSAPARPAWGAPSWGAPSWGTPFGHPWGAPQGKPQRPSITITPRSRGTETRRSTRGRAWCVRTCDGYYIPIGNDLSGAAAERRCDALCPGTETMVFRGGDDGPDGIADAVSSRGKRYGALPTAFAHRTSLTPGCRCGASVEGALARLREDATLERGDIVVTEAGVHVFTGRGRAPHDAADFTPLREAGRLPKATRQYLSEIDRAYAYAPERLAAAADPEPDRKVESRRQTKAERRAARRAERRAEREARRAAARAAASGVRSGSEPTGSPDAQATGAPTAMPATRVGGRP